MLMWGEALTAATRATRWAQDIAEGTLGAQPTHQALKTGLHEAGLRANQ